MEIVKKYVLTNGLGGFFEHIPMPYIQQEGKETVSLSRSDIGKLYE